MTDLSDEGRSDRAFGQCLGHLLFVDGARPKESKKKSGDCWTIREFAHEMGVNEKTVRNWLSNEKIPRYLNGIEMRLFGPDAKNDPRNVSLREAHGRARERTQNRTAPREVAPPSIEQIPAVSRNVAPTAQILHPEIRAVPGFTGREDLLDAIDRALWQKGGAAALTNARSAAVHGLGGVGKSVLAQEYAWRNHVRYRGVWWLRAETEQTLLDDLIALGSRLIPSLAEIPERNRAARLALDAIEQTDAETPWLLIYDNAEKPAALGKLMPRSGAHRLITSRWPRWQGHAEALPVDVFPPDVAIDFLMEGAPHPDRDAAARLAEALGYLPLALAHARAYCAASNLPFDRYRARIAERIKDLPDGVDYPASVFATFSLAMDKAAATCPEAETLMGIAAFLAPDHIPLDLITPDVIGEDALNEAVAALHNVSLITHEPLDDGSRGMSIHRLVQEVVRSRLADKAEGAKLMAFQLLRAALSARSVREYTEWPRAKRLVPHGVAILEYTLIGDLAEPAAYICNALGAYLHSRAAYVEAAPFYHSGLAVAERVLGPDHSDVGTFLSNLALLYHSQGRYEEAVPLYKRALTITERTLGPGHPDVGICLNNLAGLYGIQARFSEAELLHKRSLAIREQAFGPEHPSVATCLNNLATLYHAQRRYEDAEPLHIRALLIRERGLGLDHPDLGSSLNGLGELYREQNRFQEAEPYFKRALAVRESAFGSDHPAVGTILNNLAALYRLQNRCDEAEPLFKRSLAIREKALGLDHPSVGASLNNLASVYRAQGRDSEAALLLQRALSIVEKSLGPDHPTTKTGRANYEVLKAEMAAKGGGVA